jgi:hypothetical protein
MSVTNSSYTIASNDIAAERFEGEYVILDLASGRYIALSAHAGTVWDALMAGLSPDAIATAIETDETGRQALNGFVAQLVELGLVRPADEGTAPASLNGQLSGISGAEGPLDFTIDVFDDLSELLLADPIHEVDDKVGWPPRRS